MAIYKGFHFVSAMDKADAEQKLAGHRIALKTYPPHDRYQAGIDFYQLELDGFARAGEDSRQVDPHQVEANKRENHKRH